MGEVKWKDSNKTRVIATGFESLGAAESAIDAFLEAEGTEYGRESNGDEEDGVYSFYVGIT